MSTSGDTDSCRISVADSDSDSPPELAVERPSPVRLEQVCRLPSSGRAAMRYPVLLSYNEAPPFQRYNPYIRHGYRGPLNYTHCLKSVFWWTNETVNIWTHLGGLVFFAAVFIYDLVVFMPKLKPSWTDSAVLALLLASFQLSMVLSALYHMFSCRSQQSYHRWLTLDLVGISISLMTIYTSGIYYSFGCLTFWRNFYLGSVLCIFGSAMVLKLNSRFVSDEFNTIRLVLYVSWSLYGVVPTIHWVVLHGGVTNPLVQMLLPRVLVMYILCGCGFFFYFSKVPEICIPGKVDYVGSSHQLWHVIMVVALFHWHNTGLQYAEFRLAHDCNDELAHT